MTSVFNYFKFILNFDSHYSIIGFQDSATPIMEGIVDLHNYIFFYLILVFVVVSWMFCYIIISFFIVPTFLYDNILKNNFFKKYFQKEVFIINFFFQKFFNLVYLKNKQITYPEYLELNKLKIINNTYNRHDDYFYTQKIVEHAGVELIWTIIPSIILVLI